jgi:hypothetical protein
MHLPGEADLSKQIQWVWAILKETFEDTVAQNYWPFF